MNGWAWLVTKYALTAALVVLISEVAKRSDRLGGFIAALPLMTVLVLVWLHIERAPEATVANHAYYTFWYVLPTLPMFALFPMLLARFGFWGALGVSVLITLVSFAVLGLVLERFGIALW